VAQPPDAAGMQLLAGIKSLANEQHQLLVNIGSAATDNYLDHQFIALFNGCKKVTDI
jgi:hypothetical protein